MSRKIVSTFTKGPYRYQQELVTCGKKNCSVCKDGPNHGPYWYQYWRKHGREFSKYVGKFLKVLHDED